MTASFDQFWMRRAKVLTQWLIISGTINISLLGTIIYSVIKDKNVSVSLDLSQIPIDPTVHVSNEEILRAYSGLSYQDLLLKLENTDLAEEGFLKRDLALSCLVAFHHFDLEKALGGMISQKRSSFFRSVDAKQSIDITLFPGLADEQFNGVLAYAKTEKWPLTSKGLYFEIKRKNVHADPSLLEAFYTTPEFHVVSTFLQKTCLPADKNVVINLLSEIDWDFLKDFCEQQRILQDFSDDRRRSFLLVVLERFSSKTGAFLLTVRDLNFIARRLDDHSLSYYFSLISDHNEAVELLSKEILVSPRSDDMRKKSAQRLYEMAFEPFPETYDHLTAVQRFCPETLPQDVLEDNPVIAQAKVGLEAVASQMPQQADKKRKMHTVQEGDSLWKISKKYKVSVDEIKKINNMENDRLKLGRQLNIPDSKS
jgi:hypothetical protein